MKLSIITINYNNAAGLERTLNSVLDQSYGEIEHIIADGASTDNSVNVIKEYVRKVEQMQKSFEQERGKNDERMNVVWVSEPDKGIYNAMNKGLEIALGRRVVNADHTSSLISLNAQRSTLNESLCDYIQILNSGDILAAPDVTERMVAALESLSTKRSTLNEDAVSILYGNMLKKDYTTGKIIVKSREVEYSLRQYFSSTMNHDCCYIRRDVYEKYGLYDENLKIVSDWKWFLQVIGLGNVKPVYADIDVTIFDAGGISESNLTLRNQERRQVLEELLPPAILTDYDAHAFEIEQMKRMRRHHLYGLVYFMERVLFKLEKWHIL